MPVQAPTTPEFSKPSSTSLGGYSLPTPDPTPHQQAPPAPATTSLLPPLVEETEVEAEPLISYIPDQSECSEHQITKYEPPNTECSEHSTPVHTEWCPELDHNTPGMQIGSEFKLFVDNTLQQPLLADLQASIESTPDFEDSLMLTPQPV